MIVKPLRKGSLGIKGTYRNAEHHAQACIPLIQLIEQALKSISHYMDFTWEQGNNIHILTRENGDKLCFRPFYDDEWGIDVLAKFSRSNEMRLFTITNVADTGILISFLDFFLDIPDNNYGKRSDQE